MASACQPFGFNEDEGMQLFSIVEMFMSGLHIITAIFVYLIAADVYQQRVAQTTTSLVTLSNHTQENSKKQAFTEDTVEIVVALLTVTVMFLISLLLQAIFGFLLYLFGWKQRNLTICYIWLGVAAANKFFSILILLIQTCSPELRRHWSIFFLYLLYVFYGGWVVIGFIKWAQARRLGRDSCECNRNCFKRQPAVVPATPSMNRSRGRGGPPASAAGTIGQGVVSEVESVSVLGTGQQKKRRLSDGESSARPRSSRSRDRRYSVGSAAVSKQSYRHK